MRHRHPRFGGTRTRWRSPSGDWVVRARVERFVEPALLLLLRERPMHGYELLELLPQVAADERIDVGNVYRALRALEEDGVVSSEWHADLPGPAKRTYTLSDEGRRLLAAWAEGLTGAQAQIAEFLKRYDDERR